MIQPLPLSKLMNYQKALKVKGNRKMIKAIVFTTTGEQVIIRDSLDEVQNQINSTVGVRSFRIFQVNGKKQIKKERNNGTR